MPQRTHRKKKSERDRQTDKQMDRQREKQRNNKDKNHSRPRKGKTDQTSSNVTSINFRKNIILLLYVYVVYIKTM